ncbi:hypothetical protein J4401_03695 [Candidatus Woesearchaeota archaeon]|nr:hypothetical protein [Candidatus Woesearchaeota archaeon]
MSVFSRSWEITKLSFSVIKHDKELLLFPIMSGIFSVAFIIAMIFPTIVLAAMGGKNIPELTIYAVLFAVYFGLAFIATFFNVCTVYTSKIRFEGGNATFMESIRFGFSRLPSVFAWSLVSATVGILLQLIDRAAEKMGQVGQTIVKIITGLLGAAWSILIIFVVPAMVYNNLGPIDAIKKSAVTLSKTWGENLIRGIGLGLARLILIVVGIILTIAGVYFTLPLGTYWTIGIISAGAIYVILVSLVFAIANTVFNTALYVYAETGKVPASFTKEAMESAFRPSKPSFSGRGI